ncbi:MAG: deoxyribodipyrimidine photo-lyase [Hyphomicrobiales bacterium]
MTPSDNSAPCLFWFREDLRLKDNPALHAAIENGQPLICLFIYDEKSEAPWAAGGARKWWLHHSLNSLKSDIEALGSRLTLLAGSQEDFIPDIVEKTGATHVYWTRRYSPSQIEIDKRIKATLEAKDISVTSMNGRLLHEPWHFKTGSGQSYRVFTPLWKAMKARGTVREAIKSADSMTCAKHSLQSLELEELDLLPTSPNWAEDFSSQWQPGEAGAQQRLARFITDAAAHYREARNRPDKLGTSGLSPHLHHGEISPVQIWHAIKFAIDAGDIPLDQADVFLSEIAWREFSYVLLFHNPDMLTKEINPKFSAFPWRQDSTKLQAWQRGQTGYPIVDAGMRELWQTGWMHNRVRMIVGSFLVKHLLIDWRDGMAWFWDTLLDADIGANTASWQWIAGCGADAAPYFRIFNPMLQGAKFDPNGDYIRRFVPELEKLPNKYLNEPWEASTAILKEAGIVLGDTYPHPIVDHKKARDLALTAYQRTKSPL